jgi:hypothetical protein
MVLHSSLYLYSSLLRKLVNYGCKKIYRIGPREPSLKGRLSSVGPLVLTSTEQLLLKLNILFLFDETSCLNKEVNRTEPSPSVRVPVLS